MTERTKFASGRKTGILVVDDHPLVREGLAARISPQPDMEICGEADSVASALEQVAATSPDVCLIDVQLVDSHGIDLIKEIHGRFPSIKMLVVSAFDESLYAERALRAGAHGYINKRELQDNILVALRTVIDGQRYLSPKMTQQLVGQLVGSKESIEADPIQRLSDRELEIFQLIGHGNTSGAIARQLHLSPHTIDTHREKIKRKLDLKNAAELQRAATQWMLENG